MSVPASLNEITFRVGNRPPAPHRKLALLAQEAIQTLSMCVRYAAVVVGGVAALAMAADWMTR